ncbi:unnamed protein product [Clonostachys byssicola]|uniref:NAD(P)-binding protein n=1 Tax=Clonostachys byssicola TaxID=160290 RepID=A0A9N9Y6U1_9HYPO|nr:unnamed protein product [Clonostachys byssicola]
MAKHSHNCWAGSQTFNPEIDIPDLSSKVCLVTGGNSGLGEATVTALAKHNPKLIYLAARSRPRGEAAVSRIKATSPATAEANIQVLDLDLASFASVQAAAARVIGETDRLDLLQLNGGVGMVPAATTLEGYELQFGTNYMGHVLLTQLLLPTMLKTAGIPGTDVRIVSMSSIGHKLFAPNKGIVFGELKTDMGSHGGAELYAQSMLAKALFAYEFAKRYPQITATSLHPGTVKSGVWNGDKNVNWLIANAIVKPVVALTGVSNDEGAKTQLWCSFSKDAKSGCYYEPIGKAGKESKLARDDALSTALWEWTDKELQAYGTAGWADGHE